MVNDWRKMHSLHKTSVLLLLLISEMIQPLWLKFFGWSLCRNGYPSHAAWRGCGLYSSELRSSTTTTTTFLVFRLLLSFLISHVFGYAPYAIIFWTLVFLRYLDFSLFCLDSMWFWIMTVWIIFHFWMIGLCLVMTYNWLCPLYYIILCWLTRTLAFWCCQRGREMGWYRSLEIK